jgi:hypothetical protein
VVGGQHHAPAALPPVKTRYPLYRRLGGPQGRSKAVIRHIKYINIIYISLHILILYFIPPLYRSGVIHYTIQSASIPRSRRLWLQFLYIKLLSQFNIFNLHLIFLTFPAHNLTTCNSTSTGWTRPIFDNCIQFYIVTNIVQHIGSHSANKIALYVALP